MTKKNASGGGIENAINCYCFAITKNGEKKQLFLKKTEILGYFIF
jgi:hypothetical protein